MSFLQHAEDNFTVEVTGPYHCGPNHDSPKQFRFEVDMEYPESALDANGFLLDNTTFKRYFNELGTIHESCEQLVIRAAHELAALAGGRAVTCKVAIWAIPGSAKVQYLLHSKTASA